MLRPRTIHLKTLMKESIFSVLTHAGRNPTGENTLLCFVVPYYFIRRFTICQDKIQEKLLNQPQTQRRMLTAVL